MAALSLIDQLITFFSKNSDGKIVPTDSWKASFVIKNKYDSVVSSAYKFFVDNMKGTGAGWKYQGEKNGVKKSRKDIKTFKFPLYRGEKILNYPQNVLIHGIRDKRIRFLLGDGHIKKYDTLEVIDGHCRIQFDEYKSPAPFVKPREFVYLNTIYRLPDDTILSFSTSILHSKRPKSSKYTRANLKIGGWAFQKIPDHPNKTRAIYIVCCDIGGSVPKWIVKKINNNVPMTVERLNVSLKKLGNIKQFNKPLMNVLVNDQMMHPINQISDDEK